MGSQTDPALVKGPQVPWLEPLNHPSAQFYVGSNGVSHSNQVGHSVTIYTFSWHCIHKWASSEVPVIIQGLLESLFTDVEGRDNRGILCQVSDSVPSWLADGTCLSSALGEAGTHQLLLSLAEKRERRKERCSFRWLLLLGREVHTMWHWNGAEQGFALNSTTWCGAWEGKQKQEGDRQHACSRLVHVTSQQDLVLYHSEPDPG